MANKPGSQTVNGALLRRLCDELGWQNADLLRAIDRMGGDLSERKLDQMMAGDSTKTSTIRIVADALKSGAGGKHLAALRTSDLFQENSRSLDEIIERGDREAARAQGGTVFTTGDNIANVRPMLDVLWPEQNSDERRSDGLMKAISTMHNTLQSTISGITLSFMLSFSDPDAKAKLANNLEQMIRRINTTGQFIITELRKGSIAVTVTMGEDDAIRLTELFVDGEMDDLNLMGVEFAQISQRLQAQAAKPIRSNTKTTIMLPDSSSFGSILLTRSLDLIDEIHPVKEATHDPEVDTASTISLGNFTKHVVNNRRYWQVLNVLEGMDAALTRQGDLRPPSIVRHYAKVAAESVLPQTRFIDRTAIDANAEDMYQEINESLGIHFEGSGPISYSAISKLWASSTAKLKLSTILGILPVFGTYAKLALLKSLAYDITAAAGNIYLDALVQLLRSKKDIHARREDISAAISGIISDDTSLRRYLMESGRLRKILRRYG